ncbi:hypothetical protein [Aliikangiella coralliicola]|uniref:Uncharacterized protein n=1 Tax=Aliikangiella coralliicola TaxID=2592383 RepID=A0A545U6G2_9GAMM|nr:hypothetical protein [Aliikangiella coralliicola]TQV85065.1 hypothetical protein FLL46_22005 [Aliikangiella coralliicola]
MKIVNAKIVTLALGLLFTVASQNTLASLSNLGGSYDLTTTRINVSEIQDFCNWDGASDPGIGRWRHCTSIRPLNITGQTEASNAVIVTYYLIDVVGPSAPDPKPKGGYGTK